jgi:hypothetical protein
VVIQAIGLPSLTLVDRYIGHGSGTARVDPASDTVEHDQRARGVETRLS